MSTFGNRIQTTTQDKIMPMVVDTVLNSNVFATRMLRKAKKWSGEKIKYPVKYQKNNNSGSFDGVDTFSTAATDTRVNMEFDPRFFRQTVSLPLTEISVNDVSGTKVLDLVRVEVASATEDMADSIGSLFYGDGTGNSGKDFLGLGALVDDGSNVANIGGLSRSTYTTLQSTVTASSGTLSIAKMRTLYDNVASGAVKPTAGLTTETIFSLYDQLLEPKERIMRSGDGSMGELKAGAGHIGLDFRGVPILADEKCTAGNLYFLNEDFIEWRALPFAMSNPIPYRATDIEGNDYSNVTGLGFSWSGWIKPVNQAAVTGHIYLGGNLVTSNPKRHGVLTGITAV